MGLARIPDIGGNTRTDKSLAPDRRWLAVEVVECGYLDHSVL